MRTSINYNTFTKVKDFFIKSKEEHTFDYIQNKLGIDYYSLRIALDLLLKDKTIKKVKTKYKARD